MKAILIIVGLLILVMGACSTENKVEANTSLLGRTEINSYTSLRYVKAPDGHNYMVYYGNKQGGLVHAEGCPNHSRITN